MLENIKREIREVSVRNAKRLQTYVDHRLQRRFRQDHADKLAYIMEQGAFYQGEICIAHMNGTKVLANGQHQIAAIIKTGLAQWCAVHEWRCETDEDYENLFNAFDTESRNRTQFDSAQAFLMAHRNRDAFKDASARALANFRSGMERWLYIVGKPIAVLRVERLRACEEYMEQFDLYRELTKVNKTGRLGSATIAAIIGTSLVHYDLARQFWLEVLSGFYTVNAVDYPPYKLHHYLRSAVIVGGGLRQTRPMGISTVPDKAGRIEQTQFDIYMACIRAWDFYITRRMIKTFRQGKSNQPKLPAVPNRHVASEILRDSVKILD